MQDITTAMAQHLNNEKSADPVAEHEEKFVPKGAIAFFLLMIFIYAGMWFSIYFDLIGRH